MPIIHGIEYPDIITGKTAGAALLRIYSGSGEDLTQSFNICQFNFLTGHAVVALKDKEGKIIFENGKPIFKALIVKNPKFSVHGQKPVSVTCGKG